MFTENEKLMMQLHRLAAITRRGCGPKCPPKPCGDDRPPMPPDAHDGRPMPPPPMFMGRVLPIICENPSISQHALADKLDIRPQSLSEAIVKLESDGFIRREENENDKREILLFVTDEGKNRLEQFAEHRRKHAEDFFSALTDDEKKTLSELLNKVIETNSQPKQER